jgi:hypothetical protein
MNETRVLSFPPEVFGRVDWTGRHALPKDLIRPDVSRTPGVRVVTEFARLSPVTAIGDVEVPVDQPVSLDVGPSDRRTPLDLGFLVDLPPDSVEALHVKAIVPRSIEHVVHLSPGLRRLYLGWTGLGDEALVHVARLTGLIYLQTWGNAFTDEACHQLVALQHLEHLYLEEETLSVAALSFVNELPHLTRLGLDDLRITSEELEALRASLPDVRVG